MTDNLRHWDFLAKTDPSHTKPFQRAGGFRGTAVKPIWATHQMTKHFGPCGAGWGMEKPEFTTMPVGDEILVYCTVALWYREGESEGNIVYGVGGDKVAVKRKDGGVVADDEAFKKAYTDALSNAMKQIGVGADVHMGLFDDAKYVNELRKEFAEDDTANPPANSPKAPPPPQAEAKSARTPAMEEFFKRQSYEISPAKVGGIGAWDKHFKSALGACKNLDEMCKVEEDNRQHLRAFNDTANAAVTEALRQFLVTQEERLKIGMAA